MRWATFTAVPLAVASLLATACGGVPSVPRVVDGRVVWGAFIDSPSYATFLKAALEEARGEPQAALTDYELVAREGDEDPEVWTRIGALACSMPGQQVKEATAFGRALTLDPEYGPAWAAKARCALSAGHTAEAASDAAHAEVDEPRAVDPQLVLARTLEAEGKADAARARLVALTLTSGSIAAWDALASWGRGHGDAALVALALRHVAVLDPARRAELGEAAVAMAAEGAVGAGRDLAAAVLDAPGDRSSGGLGPAAAAAPLVARFAIDRALLAGDAELARARAVRAHLGLDVVAARALLMGDSKTARAVVVPLLAADPEDRGASYVALATRGPLAAPDVSGPASAEAVVALAAALVRAGATSAALRVTRESPHEPFLAGDPLLTPVLVDLAAAGGLDEQTLPAEAAIELAARRTQAPPEAALSKADARHRLFGLALVRPLDPETARLAQHLAGVGARDPLVAVALVRIALARGDGNQGRVMDRLVEESPVDPIVLMTALDVASRSGDASAVVPARARLTAIARTPEERARAKE